MRTLISLLAGFVTVIIFSTSSAVAQIDPPDLWEPILLPTLHALSNGAAAWGDYDGDGDLDLFYSGNSGTFDDPQPFTQLYFNEGEIFVIRPDPSDEGGIIELPATDYTDALDTELPTIRDIWRSSVDWGDYDNDGRLDILATGMRENGVRETSIYRNVPNSDRIEDVYQYPGVSDGDVAWGDYDNDGDLDFVISGMGDSGTAVTWLYENRVKDGGDFLLHDAGLVGVSQSSVAWGDFDNDMDLDLLVAGIAQPQRFVTILYRNDGNGSFSEVSADLEELFASSVAWGDGDADGDLDILLSGAELNPFLLEGKILVYENVDGAFSKSNLTLFGSFEGDPVFGRYAGSAEWGDFNNDGVMDFFVTGFRQPLDAVSGQTFESLGGQTYVKSTIGFRNGKFSGEAYGTTFWGDYDNDGDLDLFIMGRGLTGDAIVIELRNFLPFYPRNRLPHPPGFLSAVVSGNVSGNQVELSWAPGNDGFNPAESLSYNIRVGSEPGAGDVVSPMAIAGSGQRLVAAYGNAQQNLGWVIKNLEPGTYYWSVQSIDTSYKGSQFSVESTFTISAE